MANMIKVKSYPFSTYNPLKAKPTNVVFVNRKQRGVKIILNIYHAHCTHTFFGCFNLFVYVNIQGLKNQKKSFQLNVRAQGQFIFSQG